MGKVTVVLRLAKKTIPQKIETGRLIVTSMTGNANFPSPHPTLPVVTTGINALETTHIAALNGGKDDTANMRITEAALNLALTSLGNYVESIANASPASAEAIVLSAGMDIKRMRAPLERGFRLERGEYEGQIKLRTNYQPNSTVSWAMTLTPADESSWQVIHSSTRSKHIVTGLNSGSRYYFRYSRVGSKGQEPWSNVLNIIAN